MTTKTAKVYFGKSFAGILSKTGQGYFFVYDKDYMSGKNPEPISINFPVQREPFISDELFPFFKGLIPEGWLFEINARTLKIDPADDFSMLINTARDCIGAVSVIPIEEE